MNRRRSAVNPGSLDRNYDLLRQVDPNYLWYILSLSLWWRSSIPG